MKTAIEWLIDNLKGQLNIDEVTQVVQHAKEMEKEQIMDAFEQGENNSVDYFNPENNIEESEQYYNETYGGNK